VAHIATDYNQSTIFVYNFAQNGAELSWLDGQVNEQFIPKAGRHPEWAPWTSRNSLFSMSPSGSLISVTWVGINDLNRNRDTQTQLTHLFDLQDNLYQAGARKFIFMTVPPFDRAPLGISPPLSSLETPDDLPLRIAEWNTRLREYVDYFRKRYVLAFVSIYDVAAVFRSILDNPKRYKFKDATSDCHSNECFWYDNLHPTAPLYKFMAQDLSKYLLEI
jgi:phospholipase/lecithinase/hemolysin